MFSKVRTVLIVGNGESGKSALAALEKEGCKCIVCDRNSRLSESEHYDMAVVSPGVARSSKEFDYALKTADKVIGELELGFLLNGDRPVIAVTGTNGKTTVTELVGHILGGVMKTAVCGNIGTPFSKCAFEGEYDVAVVETSSFQLETVSTFRPHIACITNIDSDHLDRHGSVENYARLKLSIADNQTAKDFLVLSQDGIPSTFLKDFSPRSDVWYTALDRKVRGAYSLGGELMFMNERICAREDFAPIGDFNTANALSAICICRLAGVDSDTIASALRTFDTAPHRLKPVRTLGGRTYWDDSKGTNIAATLAACAAMKGDTLLILGGSDKGYGYDELFEKMSPKIKEIVLLGETADKIEESARRFGFGSLRRVDSLSEAVSYASEREVENVLLSPASASFDMFKNYEERGEAFIRAVKEL